MNEDIFELICEEAARVAGSLSVRDLLMHLKRDHNNPSWAPTLNDLKQAIEEIKGEKIIVGYE